MTEVPEEESELTVEVNGVKLQLKGWHALLASLAALLTYYLMW